MTAQKPASLLNLMSEKDADRVLRSAKLREATKSEVITNEWMMLAELGVHFGYEAIQAVLNDVITLQQARMLIEGARKLHSADVYDIAVAGAAANSQKASAFKKIMKPFADNMKVPT